MPNRLNDYLKAFNEAESAARQFQKAVDEVVSRSEMAKHYPALLLKHAIPDWQTQQEIRDLYRAAVEAKARATVKYRSIAIEQLRNAKHPDKIAV